MQQVFLNIISNAESAMLEANSKGTLTITTEKRNSTVKISFADDGPGIDEETLNHIFDPFFTTKEVGKGTGLGLSISHGIIQDHGGIIYVNSKSGDGATFIVELPIITEKERIQLAERDSDKMEKATGAKILIVDKAHRILQMLSRSLTGEGHKVDTVDNAYDAYKMIENKRYSLILIDMELPDMSAIDLYNRMQNIAKSLAERTVFITDETMGADKRDFLAETKAYYLSKPFKMEQFKEDIDNILSRRV
jgi:CheY-like chemotaxis protein